MTWLNLGEKVKSEMDKNLVGTGAEFKALRIFCGTDREIFAGILGVEPKTVSAFERPRNVAPKAMMQEMRLFAGQVRRAVGDLLAQNPTALPLFGEDTESFIPLDYITTSWLYNSAVSHCLLEKPELAFVYFNGADYSDFLASKHLTHSLPALIAWAGDYADRRAAYASAAGS